MTTALEPIKYKKSDIRKRDLRKQVGEFIAQWGQYRTRAIDDGSINAIVKKNDEYVFTPSRMNIIAALKNHPFLQGCLAWSLFEDRAMLMRPLPCIGDMLPPRSNIPFPHAIDDTDITYINLCLSQCYDGTEFNNGTLNTTIDVVARQYDYNPIEMYLRSLEWDGTPRLDRWLHEALGASDDDLTSAMGYKFLIGAIRRAIKPCGHKFDSMLILEGPKGIQKSSVCRVLFGDEYFMEGIGSIKSDKLPEKLSGIWGIEIPELKGFRSASAEDQKEFLSKMSDTYRVPYRTKPATFARRCVFIGTVNDHEYLLESETDRRFWSVRCNEVKATDLVWLRANRDQLWAEAYHYAQTDEPDYLDKAQMMDMEIHQSSRVISDPWEDRICTWLSTDAGRGMEEIRLTFLLDDVLEIAKERQDKSVSTKAGKIMTDLGYVKRRRMGDGERYYYYTRG